MNYDKIIYCFASYRKPAALLAQRELCPLNRMTFFGNLRGPKCGSALHIKGSNRASFSNIN
jgi:hypothetical protein